MSEAVSKGGKAKNVTLTLPTIIERANQIVKIKLVSFKELHK